MGEATIVVGIDASEASAQALRWAAVHSQLTGLPLVAVHAWSMEPAPRADGANLHQAQEAVVRAQATVWLRRALATCDAVPYRVRLEISEGPVTEVLRRQCEDAQLLVLGHPGGHEPQRSGQAVVAVDSGALEGIDCPVVTVPLPVSDQAAPESLSVGPVDTRV